MQLWLKPALAQSIVEHAKRSIPNECCGVIIGVGIEGQEVVPVPNIAPKADQHYRMDDQTLIDLFFRAQRENREIVGFYHSHPNSAPIPSRTDVQFAAYPDIPYMIVGLRNGEAELSAWSIQPHAVKRVEVIVAKSKPPPEEAPLSIVHKRAIIAAVVIATAFMLILSLSLLPPAPIIPMP